MTDHQPGAYVPPDRDAVRDRVLDEALRHGNTVEHATDLAVAFVAVYEEATRVAALPGEFPRPSSLIMAPLHDLYTRLRPATTPTQHDAWCEKIDCCCPPLTAPYEESGGKITP